MTGVEQLKNRCKHWFETTSDREIYSLTIILSLIRAVVVASSVVWPTHTSATRVRIRAAQIFFL